MSDIHAFYSEFCDALDLIDLSGDNKLILLGDYIHVGDSPYQVLDKIIELQNKYGSDKVIALIGNHEEMAINGMWNIDGTYDKQYEDNPKDIYYLKWMENLPLYHKEGKFIFCHAGIDEECDPEMWEWSTAKSRTS
jgi:serine/threonine protein phosphatase 1